LRFLLPWLWRLLSSEMWYSEVENASVCKEPAALSSSLKREAGGSFKTVVSFCQTIWYYISKDRNPWHSLGLPVWLWVEQRGTSINASFDIISVVQLKIQVFWIVVLGLLKNSYILKDNSVSIFRAMQSKKNYYVEGIGKLCIYERQGCTIGGFYITHCHQHIYLFSNQVA
jgi:hypothetical protein